MPNLEPARQMGPTDSVRRIAQDILRALINGDSWAGWTADGRATYGDGPVPEEQVRAEGIVVVREPMQQAILAGIITQTLCADSKKERTLGRFVDDLDKQQRTARNRSERRRQGPPSRRLR